MVKFLSMGHIGAYIVVKDSLLSALLWRICLESTYRLILSIFIHMQDMNKNILLKR